MKMEMLGWERQAVHAIGGLIGIGISENEAFAFVISWQGRGIYELEYGKRIDRNSEAPAASSTWIDQGKRSAMGIGPMDKHWIGIVGMWGGELKRKIGNWKVELKQSNGKDEIVLSDQISNKSMVIDKPISDIRALGFSDSGKFLFIATSCDFAIWKQH
jgi:hypothetical protein